MHKFAKQIDQYYEVGTNMSICKNEAATQSYLKIDPFSCNPSLKVLRSLIGK